MQNENELTKSESGLILCRLAQNMMLNKNIIVFVYGHKRTGMSTGALFTRDAKEKII